MWIPALGEQSQRPHHCMWGRKVEEGVQEEERRSRRVCAGSAVLRTQSQGSKHSKAWLTSLENKAPGLGGHSGWNHWTFLLTQARRGSSTREIKEALLYLALQATEAGHEVILDKGRISIHRKEGKDEKCPYPVD